MTNSSKNLNVLQGTLYIVPYRKGVLVTSDPYVRSVKGGDEDKNIKNDVGFREDLNRSQFWKRVPDLKVQQSTPTHRTSVRQVGV